MTTGQTLKTGDVIRSLNLDEIHRQQRRVATLLNGDPKGVPLLSYRRTDASSYRGENLGTRRWPPGVEIHQRTKQTDGNKRETFWERFDDDSSTKVEQSKTAKDYRLHLLNNSPNDELTSSTPLPPIDSHKTRCAHRQSPDGARTTLEKRRQESSASQIGIPRNAHATRNSNSLKKSRNRSSKPVVKYQHQKLEPSAEERYRKYRHVTIDGERKVTSVSTPEVWLRTDSSLSSVSDISALRRRHVQFQSDEEENDQRSSMLKLSSAMQSNQFAMEMAGLDNRNPGLKGTEKGNPTEDNSDAELAIEYSGRCHPTPVADGSIGKEESSVRLPDIQIHSSYLPVLAPEARRFNSGIGETSRAFVYSYFDHLPSVSGSCNDNLGSGSDTHSKSTNVNDTKNLIRRK